MVEYEKPVGSSQLAFLTTINQELYQVAKYIVINGIKIDKNYQDFVPETFGRLTTIGPKFILRNPNGTKQAYQVCLCACGSIGVYATSNVVRGNSTQCVSCKKEKVAAKNTHHGENTSVPEYSTWANLLTRTRNKNTACADNYINRGIKTCARWQEPNGQGYLNFLADMGRKPGPEYTIERKDNNGDYCPENCKWATKKEQNRNRRSNIYVTIDGVTKLKTDWLDEAGISSATLRWRLNAGWSIERAYTEKNKYPDRKWKK